MKDYPSRSNATDAQYIPDRFLRVNQVLELFPVSRSRWWQGVKEGIYPQGVKLSPRTTAWRESEIMALIERLTAEARAQGAA